MKTLTAFTAVLFGIAVSQPTSQSTRDVVLRRRAKGLCPDFLYSSPNCCGAEVLGVAGLGCSTRMYFLQRNVLSRSACSRC